MSVVATGARSSSPTTTLPRKTELVDDGRLRHALDMFEIGEQGQRPRLRREYPDADDSEIESKVREWLRGRQGAEHGDHPGSASRRF